MNSPDAKRTVFIVSDGTGITAETFSHSVLSQFEKISFTPVRIPFTDSAEKAAEAVLRINRCAEEEKHRPLVFGTLVNPEIATLIGQANGVFLDLFGTFVRLAEDGLNLKADRSVGRSHLGGSNSQYHNRIEAINFTLAHDDGQFVHGLEQADVILVGVSRCGKTPTSLYLAMQYAVKAANFPLIPDDFQRGALPSTLMPFRKKLFGLSIDPVRLSEVRDQRRPGSQYAELEQCMYEVAQAERLMRMELIPCVSTTTRSIEEISTKVLTEIGLNRSSF
jgi:regulator of PEP synthase PpsR (kinase-PPPase family)